MYNNLPKVTKGIAHMPNALSYLYILLYIHFTATADVLSALKKTL